LNLLTIVLVTLIFLSTGNSAIAAFDANPKLRYMVVSNREEATRTMATENGEQPAEK
jgi:hypothetical protein